MSPYDFLIAAGAGGGALATLLGIIWWLVRPRVDLWARGMIRAANRNTEQLAPGGAVHDNAAAAAEAVAELPALRERLEEVALHGTELSQRHDAELKDLSRWRDASERWQDTADQRIALLEQALIALLGEELSRRLGREETST